MSEEGERRKRRDRGARLDSLTGLRFVAAMLVVANHVGDVTFPAGGDGVAAWLSLGRIGVSFFFILSGFVLAWSGSGSGRVSTFYWHRLSRVAPSHLVTWGIVVALLLIAKGATDRAGLLASLPLVQSWFPSSGIHFGGNSVSWSLSCELFFYAVFPMLIRILARASLRLRRVLIFLVVAIALVIPVIATTLLPGDITFWFVYVLPVVRLVEFALGVLLAMELRDGRLPTVGLSPAIAFVGVGVSVSMTLPDEYRPVAATIVPFAAVIVAAAQRDLRGGRHWMSSPSMVLLGTWSFAFYLVHRFAIELVDRVVPFEGRAAPTVFALGGVATAVGVAFAAVLYAVVERPAERWLRARSPRRYSDPLRAASEVAERVGPFADQRCL